MKRFLKLRHGQKGFTLIELLVVVAILGVLAAVAIPNVAKFIGTGTLEAANTEAHNVTLAVTAYMADNTLADFGGDVGPSTGTGPEEFLVNPDSLQATYTITDGAISNAVKITDSKWGDLVWDNGWVPPPPTT